MYKYPETTATQTSQLEHRPSHGTSWGEALTAATYIQRSSCGYAQCIWHSSLKIAHTGTVKMIPTQ